MRHAKRTLLAAAVLAVPSAGAAQSTSHFSIGIGLAAQAGSAYSPGIGLAYQAERPGSYFGIGFTAALGSSDYYDDYTYAHHGGWDPYHCWGYEWYTPWFGCDGYYPPFHFRPWWSWGAASWGFFGFFGWPTYRVVHHHHWYGFSPYWDGFPSHGYGGWGWYPDYYHGWGWDRYVHRPRVRYVHSPYDRGYRTGRRAVARGSAGNERIVRGSPLFGPRYKEDPRRARVADNGRERTGTRAVPRDGRAGTRTETPTTRRTPTRTARPTTTRTTPPKVRARPETTTRVRPAPTRKPTSRAVPRTPRRTTPTTRAVPTRRPTPVMRPPTRGRPSSTARPRSARTPPAKANPAPSRRPTSKARPTPTKRTPPKVRPAPSQRSAPKPKASALRRSAPKPKASPPRRPPSRAKAPPPRRSGGAKPPPRRGGK